jgi:ribulose-5-phosphate 4-epimerase/fuculose-1-phosphate aldolase
VILLEKHGMVTLGDDLFKAYHLAEMAEDNALMNLYIRLLKQDAPGK